MNKTVSIIIPARNEEKNIPATVAEIQEALRQKGFPYEIVIVNDNSTDTTIEVVSALMRQDPRVRLVNNTPPFGFGNAIRKGLKHYEGEYVVIMMADGSDSPQDMICYVEKLHEGYECCFGSRWVSGARVENYPRHKLILNRIVNRMISLLFGIRYHDVTNAFKAYTRNVIEGISPILSHHFNITVELPLKAIVRGYTYTVVPTNWRQRRHGATNLKLKEMGSRYLFIILYVLLEKWLCRKDYQRK